MNSGLKRNGEVVHLASSSRELWYDWSTTTFFSEIRFNISLQSTIVSLRFATTRWLGLNLLPKYSFVRKAQFCRMQNFLPILSTNKHHALLQDSVRSCILEELAQVQKETDDQDIKYKHVATEVFYR